MPPARPYPRALGALALAAAGAVVALASGRVSRVEVTGPSMGPGLLPGDRLLVLKGVCPRSGHVVVVGDPRPGGARDLVKRVTQRYPGGALSVVGDRPEASTDSRTFGPVPPSLVRGRAVWRYWPPERRGPVESRSRR